MHILASLVIFASIASSAVFNTAIAGPCTGPNTRTTPPADAIVVDATGKYAGSFKTVSEGVAHIPSTTTTHTLFLFPGIYQEQVVVPKLMGSLVIQGYTCDTMSYANNQVTITHAMAQKDLPASVTNNRNARTSTLWLKPENVKIYNLNVANSAGNVGQAIAMMIDGVHYGLYACKLTGYQDTLYANKGTQLFARSYIGGAVDFIFGITAKAWFESCDFESVGTGCITANGRDSETNPSYYVFNNANVFGSGAAGSAFLGRPWRPHARVVWQKSKLSAVINPQGWQKWNNDSNTQHVFFKEFKNSGPGAAINQRVPFSGQLTNPVAITDILGASYASEWWVDTRYL